MAADIAAEQRPAGSGGFLRWWLDELGAALLPRRTRRRHRPAVVPRRGFLLLLAADGGEWGVAAFTVLLRRRRRGRAGPRRLGTLELPPPVPGADPGAADGGSGAGAAGPEGQRLAALLRRGRQPVVLALDAGEALLCDDLLPAGAEAELDRIMAHRIDLLTPWGPEQVRSGYRVLGRDPDGQLRVLVAALPRAVADPPLARLAAHGIPVDSLDLLRGEAEGGGLAGLNLLGRRDSGPSRASVVSAWLAALLLAAAVIAGGALATRDYLRHRAALEDRRELAAALEGRLADLPDLRARIDRLRAEAGFVAERQRATPSPLVVLEVLSRILPDSIWLDQIALDGRELTLSGYAEEAAQVLPIIESSAHFEGAEFRAPSTRVTVPGPGGGRREVERFSLGATVAPLPEPEP